MLWLVAGLAGPANQAPARGASTSPAEQIQLLYQQLADRDPQLRERARFELMGTPREQLPLLEKVVAENRPIHPTQAAVLYDIVMHVYQAGEPYETVEDGGAFLGLRELDSWSSPAGVLVNTRIPGFCAYRAFRAGDVIVGIAEMQGIEFHTVNQFIALMRTVPPGQTLTFLVLRDGTVKKIAVRVDARPAAAAIGAPNDAMTRLENTRHAKAEEYWARAFAPLVERDSVSVSKP